MVIIRRNIYNPEKDVSAIAAYNDIDTKNTGNYGTAVDIGTTTIALGLFSLDTKKHIANITEINLQTKYGSDVMMRIMHANMGKSNILHELVINQIEDMLEHIRNEICPAYSIKKMTVVGNTTMCHLFLNKDLSKMAGAPFIPAYDGSVSVSGKNIGLKKYPHLNIYVLPGVTAHIGADAVSMLCSKKLYISNKIQLAIDIGTNAEILLNNKGEIYACSAAAGSVFERHGTRADSGVINGIKISKTTGNILLDVIDADTESVMQKEIIPKGICGSGLVDAVAELLKIGVLKEDGYLMECNEALKSGVPVNIAKRLNRDNSDKFFILYNSSDSYIEVEKNQNIVITQKDIRNIQLAKAAIQAGTEILFQEANICLESVDEIKIAGVFGKFIHPKSAILFGLYPDVDKSKIEFIGNAAGNGAAMALLDEDFKSCAEKYAKKVKHIELAYEDTFKNKFLNAMQLKKW